jgi:Bacterial Ig-like domain (group 3)
MRLNRPRGAASKPVPAEGTGGLRGLRPGAITVRAVAVTAAAAAACAMWALPAMAAPAGSVTTTTTVTKPAYIDTVQAGTAETLTATVTATDGTTPAGTVEFVPTNIGDGPFPGYIVCNATLDATGTGSCTVDPPVGTWGFVLYEATYVPTGGSEWAGSVSTGEHKLITPDPTFTTVEGPATAAAAGNVTITADVVPDTYGGPGYNILAGFSETGGDTVAFAVDGTTVCAASALQWNATAGVNYATCAASLGTGSHQVVATYSGDEYTNGSTSKTFTVVVGGTGTTKHASTTTASASPKTAFTRQDVKLSATVKSSGDAPSGTVTFWYGTRKLCVAKVSKGVASCKALFFVASKKTVTARYSGDSTHKVSSGTVTVTIKRR